MISSRRSTGSCVKATPPRRSWRRSKKKATDAVPARHSMACRSDDEGLARPGAEPGVPAFMDGRLAQEASPQPRGSGARRHAGTTGGFMKHGKRYRAAADL